MVKIDRYIRKTVFLAMLVVLLALSSLDLVFMAFDEIADTNEHYKSLDALKYVCFTFPSHIYELLPMSALIGALVGLGIMASSNELVVMQAAGVRVSRIVWSVMKPTIVVMLFGLCLGEYIAPTLELKGEVSKSIARGGGLGLSQQGFWQRNENEYMHFNAIDAEGVMQGLTIYEYEEQQLLSNTFAETARYKDSAENSYWLLENGTKTKFLKVEGQLVSDSSSFNEKVWDVDLSPDLLQVMMIDADKMAISDLYRYASRLESQGQDASQYLLSFWKKFLQPLTTAALVLVAISFIFGPLREATMGSRVFTAVCFGLVFIIVQRLLNTVSLVYQFNPFFAVLVPIAVVGFVGIYLLRRAV